MQNLSVTPGAFTIGLGFRILSSYQLPVKENSSGAASDLPYSEPSILFLSFQVYTRYTLNVLIFFKAV